MKLLIFLLITGFNTHPPDSILFEHVIEISAEKAYADNAGNLYIISDNVLTKYNSDYKESLEFSPESGELITDIDCQNPHKIIISFADQNKFIITDNRLNIISSETYYKDIGISGEAIISRAFDGGCFIYDKTYNILYKTDTRFTIEYQKYLDLDIDPIKIRNTQHSLIFSSKTGTHIIYNSDLSIKKLVSETYGAQSIFIVENRFICFDKKRKMIKVKSLDSPHQILSQYYTPKNLLISNIIIGGNKIFALTESAIYAGNIVLVKEEISH